MNKKFNLGMYVFALGVGVLSGLCFSKAFYYKGQQYAYNEMEGEIRKLAEDVGKTVTNMEEA